MEDAVRLREKNNFPAKVLQENDYKPALLDAHYESVSDFNLSLGLSNSNFLLI